MVVRELITLLGIKADKKSVDTAERGFQGLMETAKKLAVAFAGLKAFQFGKQAIEQAAKFGDTIDKMSKRIGVSTQVLQEWDFVAGLAGSTLGEMEIAIRRLQLAADDASKGSKRVAEGFKELGIEVKRTDGSFKSAEELLPEMADGFQKLEDSTLKTALAQKLLGRSGTALIPMLEQGGDAIRSQALELAQLGAVMDEDFIKLSTDFIDNQLRLEKSFFGVKQAIAKELLPIINRATDDFLSWWKINGQIIRQRLAHVIGKVSNVFSRLSKTIGSVVTWFLKLLNKLPSAAKVAIIVAMAAAFLKWSGVLKLLLSPMGKIFLLIGLLVLIIEDLIVFVEGGESAFGKLFAALDEITGLDVSGFFKDLIRSVQGLADLEEPFDWTDFWDEMVLVMKGHLASALDFWKNFWDDLPPVVTGFLGWFESTWQTLFDFFTAPLALIVDYVTDVFEVGIVEAFIRLKDHVTKWANTLFDISVSPFVSLNEFINDVFEVNIIDAFIRLKDTIVTWAKDIFGIVTKPLKRVSSFVSSLFGGEETEVKIKTVEETVVEGTKRIPKDTRSLVEGAKQITERVRGPEESRALAGGIAKARPSVGREVAVTNAPSTSVQIDVKATPGMNEEKLAQVTAREVSKVIDTKNREAMNALVPAVAGVR